ncbi:hypothetical protein [Sphingomonas lenta]|uniref:YbgF trimerisation domain-containing protein n=1 Tax=Sphingomonas lenta TaxID=1141887 RepID=A0A2A2SFS8_9SPHN|nr:hypothetical protein [Sphingomonas lenta]PAX08116.1 hypothetical protein CKY28_11055 [Sphingomonas lenta]
MRNLLLAACAVVLLPAGASAQQIEARVGKLESEMRAVQRKVFPGGAGRIIQPDIQPADVTGDTAPGVPATAPIADLTARVTTLEQQIATLTGQIEQNQFRARQIDEAFQAYKRATDDRLRALETRPATVQPQPQPASPEDEALVAPIEAAPARSAPRPTAAAPRPVTTAAVERPDTGDAGEDAYMYGYRLWEAKEYAGAERALKEVVAKYPKHRRASYAQNLLGRTYLDQGKPSLASIAFYENYKKMPDGERAPHSLYYLAQALQTLKKPQDACKVYGELTDVYGAKIDARMKADIAKGRAAAECGA